jgi:23S rRNA pseudouridine1911/1915/1917 synthase
VDAFLAIQLGVGRRAAARLASFARVNGRRATKGQHLTTGDEVYLELPATPRPETVDLPVVRVTPHVLVLAKPSGLPSVQIAGRNDDSFARRIASRFPECAGVGRPGESGLVHRLDTQTSGLLLAARSSGAYAGLREQFRKHRIHKVYLAVVWGHVARPIEIDAPIGQHHRSRRRMRALPPGSAGRRYAAQEATTRVSPLQSMGPLGIVRAETTSGARHQIRAHLSFAGHPLVGDGLYGGAPHPLVRGHLLHATEIRWTAPHDTSVQEDTLPPPLHWYTLLNDISE